MTFQRLTFQNKLQVLNNNLQKVQIIGTTCKLSFIYSLSTLLEKKIELSPCSTDCTSENLFLIKIIFFIFLLLFKLELSPFFPHHSKTDPPIPTSQLQSALCLCRCVLSFYMFFDDPSPISPHYPSPHCLLLLSVCSLFQCLLLCFACLLIRFHL